MDLLQIVMTDKIDVNEKPGLLHERHQVSITPKVKGDISTMTQYEEMAYKLNQYEEMSKAYNDSLEKMQDYETLKAENAAMSSKIDTLEAQVVSLLAENEDLKNK